MHIRTNGAEGLCAWAVAAFAVLALVLALALSGMGSATAFADDGEEEDARTATLTIVDGISDYTGPNAVVNATFAFDDGATLGDLFAAAKEAGLIEDYTFSYGYLYSVTLTDGTVIANASDYSYYWANYKNGEYAQGYTDCTESDALTDGVAFGFAYVSYPYVATAPSLDQWEDLLDSAEKVTIDTIQTVGGPKVAGSAMLSLVNGVSDYTGPNALVNLDIEFIEGDTLGDLFETIKHEGYIKDYAFSGGYLNSITLNDDTVLVNATDYSSYWANYKDGDYAQGDTDCTQDDVLEDNDAFMFAMVTYPYYYTAPSADGWKTLADAATAADQTVKATLTPNFYSRTVEVEASDSLTSKFNAVLEGIKDAGVLEGAGGTSTGHWLAIAASALGEKQDLDLGSILTEAREAYEKGSGLPLCIIQLLAAGVDPTKVPSADGTETYDLVDKLANTEDANFAYPSQACFALLAYACGGYVISPYAVNAPGELIDDLVAAQADDGSWGYSWGGTYYSDVDTTAMVVTALLAYYSDDDTVVSDAVEDGLNCLWQYFKKNGSFGNANSAAEAVIAMCAVGVDTTYTNAVLTDLLSYANADNSAFAYNGKDNALATSQAVQALAAYAGMVEDKASCNVYQKACDGLVSGAKQYFDGTYLVEDGAIVVDSWKKIDGAWYYAGTDGIVVTSGWYKINGTWYWFDGDGKMASSQWINDNGQWYYVQASGAMASSKWISYKGSWYYLQASGRMAASQWVKSGSSWYYLQASGKMAASQWLRSGTIWYYLQANGKMATSTWVKSSGAYYYLQANGQMAVSQWVRYGGSWYYLMRDSGKMAANTTLMINGKPYTFAASGKWVKAA